MALMKMPCAVGSGGINEIASTPFYATVLSSPSWNIKVKYLNDDGTVGEQALYLSDIGSKKTCNSVFDFTATSNNPTTGKVSIKKNCTSWGNGTSYTAGQEFTFSFSAYGQVYMTAFEITS